MQSFKEGVPGTLFVRVTGGHFFSFELNLAGQSGSTRGGAKVLVADLLGGPRGPTMDLSLIHI